MQATHNSSSSSIRQNSTLISLTCKMLYNRSLPVWLQTFSTLLKLSFFLSDLNNNFQKYVDSSLTTTHCARNLGFIFDENVTFSDQICMAVASQIMVIQWELRAGQLQQSTMAVKNPGMVNPFPGSISPGLSQTKGQKNSCKPGTYWQLGWIQHGRLCCHCVRGQSNMVDFQQSLPCWIQLCCQCVPRFTLTVCSGLKVVVQCVVLQAVGVCALLVSLLWARRAASHSGAVYQSLAWYDVKWCQVPACNTSVVHKYSIMIRKLCAFRRIMFWLAWWSERTEIAESTDLWQIGI